MKDSVVIGRVSAVYPDRNTAKVLREEKEIITKELIILARGDSWIPAVGQHVLCVFSKGNSTGYILGSL